MQAFERIIPALDKPSLEEGLASAKALVGRVGPFKAGMELVNAAGAPTLIRSLKELKADVFLDEKFHDIPTTVGNTAAVMLNLGVWMFNVHASGGLEMMKRAVAAAKGKCKVFAVTVLTSMDDRDCEEVYGAAVMPTVRKFALFAKKAGVDGIICAPWEVPALKAEPDLVGLQYITPSIRPTWYETNDQKRAATPREAIQMGADYLVIGRPLLQPPAAIGSPLDALKLIVEEVEQALSGRK
ncbi:MAG: orotidine-5'-phosphate decarboxylase [Candidatus Andersenbacteria bacterium]|nr:orotidine-5'-phosphate decarboxylase [Candidatus Andersenbacteria bacterium]